MDRNRDKNVEKILDPLGCYSLHHGSSPALAAAFFAKMEIGLEASASAAECGP